MQLDFADQRLLAVVAHPDDAELLCAGTLARARRDGAATAVCVMCRGDKGQPPSAKRDLGRTRKREMQAAARLIDARLFALGFHDGELADTLAARRKLIEVFREFAPTLVLAHWPADYHPDHRAASALAEACSWLATSPGHASKRAPLAKQPELWWLDAIAMHGFEPELYVDISEFLELKQAALACHASQLERGDSASFAPLERLLAIQAEARGLQSGVAAAEAFRIHRAFKRARAW